MQKKQKIFYLDFIRVVSMIMIVTYHFYAHFAENNITGALIPLANGKWGNIGVALFFIISGASLMYNYEEQLELKTYMKKRFVGIYPMFWIAYIALFVYLFYQSKGVPTATPLYRLIFSVFAMDGYLSCYTETIYLIGEWFLGCIVLIYILFPILRKLVKKCPKMTFLIGTILNLGILIFYKNGRMPLNRNLFVATYSFLLGMYVIKIKTFKWWQAIIGLILAFFSYNYPATNVMLFSHITAYSLYVVLAYVGNKLKYATIQELFGVISKYSYAIYLVHHYLIMKTLNTFQGSVFGIAGTGLLYLACWMQIIVVAKILYVTNREILSLFKKEKI